MTALRDLVGVPYRAHGRGMGGMDCYGLAIEVLRRNGIVLRDVWAEADCGAFVDAVPLPTPEPLCIVEIGMGNAHHVGVYIGNGRIVHARPDAGVVIEPLSHFSARIRGYYRVNGQHIQK